MKNAELNEGQVFSNPRTTSPPTLPPADDWTTVPSSPVRARPSGVTPPAGAGLCFGPAPRPADALPQGCGHAQRQRLFRFPPARAVAIAEGSCPPLPGPRGSAPHGLGSDGRAPSRSPLPGPPPSLPPSAALARVVPAARPGSGGDLPSLVSAEALARVGPPPSSRLRGLGPAARDTGTCERALGSGRWLIVCSRTLSLGREEARGTARTWLYPAALALLYCGAAPDGSGLFQDVPSFTSGVRGSLVAPDSCREPLRFRL